MIWRWVSLSLHLKRAWAFSPLSFSFVVGRLSHFLVWILQGNSWLGEFHLSNTCTDILRISDSQCSIILRIQYIEQKYHKGNASGTKGYASTFVPHSRTERLLRCRNNWSLRALNQVDTGSNRHNKTTTNWLQPLRNTHVEWIELHLRQWSSNQLMGRCLHRSGYITFVVFFSRWFDPCLVDSSSTENARWFIMWQEY